MVRRSAVIRVINRPQVAMGVTQAGFHVPCSSVPGNAFVSPQYIRIATSSRLRSDWQRQYECASATDIQEPI
ncbi:MAG: hypothetical protein CMJ18_17855 [Phycisphaeraceae bacterium]|nr:hypothetical protein [Phycisphaeraceae bacterium]